MTRERHSRAKLQQSNRKEISARHNFTTDNAPHFVERGLLNKRWGPGGGGGGEEEKEEEAV